MGETEGIPLPCLSGDHVIAHGGLHDTGWEINPPESRQEAHSEEDQPWHVELHLPRDPSPHPAIREPCHQVCAWWRGAGPGLLQWLGTGLEVWSITARTFGQLAGHTTTLRVEVCRPSISYLSSTSPPLPYSSLHAPSRHPSLLGVHLFRLAF